MLLTNHVNRPYLINGKHIHQLLFLCETDDCLTIELVIAMPTCSLSLENICLIETPQLHKKT